ncbi:hypothetical protein DSCO28_30430 [Desulfosarcina ovata subsp. sediminis]|uniref:J domain-containing protein n=1 Tax=Desulfosarcina ovata subsp. sediminis TaxID=885957 RepID=A0A5K7ZPG3_9BACT|nr:hypothetical protein [Desulfosarcina ovata]BBO82477.1 hypothetical protein DSCO28_30430 [Desulfosarcina ovata subsp. sediminis]
MKGYPTIIKRPQKRFLSYHKSRTYENPYWAPTYKGSKDYKLNGDEVDRELKAIYRVVWNVSYRDDRGRVKKQQTQLDNIQYWSVVEDFKEYLLYRQGKIDGKGRELGHGLRTLEKAHLPGKIENLTGALEEFVYEQLDAGLCERIEKKLFDKGKTGTKKDWDFVEAKIFKKWGPVKAEIIKEYLSSMECRVWLANESMRRKGPRKPTEEELKDQQQERERFERFKESFGSTFTGSGGNDSGHSNDFDFKRPSPGTVTDPELALEIISAGYKKLSKIHHPDLGGDAKSMKALNRTKEELDQLLK